MKNANANRGRNSYDYDGDEWGDDRGHNDRKGQGRRDQRKNKGKQQMQSLSDRD